jgi:hypothetical protein
VSARPFVSFQLHVDALPHRAESFNFLLSACHPCRKIGARSRRGRLVPHFFGLSEILSASGNISSSSCSLWYPSGEQQRTQIPVLFMRLSSPVRSS